MKGLNFHHKHKVGVALKPQSITNTSADGETIKEPWNHGNQISFLLQGGAFAASSDGACVIQGQKRSDDAWETLKEKDGVTNLQFTVTLLDDAGGLEGGIALGTIPMSVLDAATHKAIRLRYTESGNAAQLVSAAYIISELLSEPSGTTDDLFSKVVDIS